MNKLNKLSLRSGLFKVVGEFGLRENLYYGSIFICMTLIVIVCFLVINNRGGAGLSGLMSGGSAAAYEGGKIHLLFSTEGYFPRETFINVYDGSSIVTRDSILYCLIAKKNIFFGIKTMKKITMRKTQNFKVIENTTLH